LFRKFVEEKEEMDQNFASKLEATKEKHDQAVKKLMVTHLWALPNNIARSSRKTETRYTREGETSQENSRSDFCFFCVPGTNSKYSFIPCRKF
jgi:hypothetical protein